MTVEAFAVQGWRLKVEKGSVVEHQSILRLILLGSENLVKLTFHCMAIITFTLHSYASH